MWGDLREEVRRRVLEHRIAAIVAKCRLKQFAYLSYDLVRVEPSKMAEAFVNIS